MALQHIGPLEGSIAEDAAVGSLGCVCATMALEVLSPFVGLEAHGAAVES